MIECAAPPELEVGRFLPPSGIRLVLDIQGMDRSTQVSHERLRGQCLSSNRKLAESLLTRLSGTLRGLFERGRELADAAGTEIADNALSTMERQLGDELTRLRALAKVNPNVREDELEHLELRRVTLAEYLGNAKVRLDAARVIVVQ